MIDKEKQTEFDKFAKAAHDGNHVCFAHPDTISDLRKYDHPYAQKAADMLIPNQFMEYGELVAVPIPPTLVPLLNPELN